MKLTRDADGTITATWTAAEAQALADELLWVKNADEGGPAMQLWEALDNAIPDASEADPRRKAIADMLTSRYHGAIDITDAMIDAVLEGVKDDG